MKSFIILSCMLVATVTGKYTTKYDDINVMEILQNKRLLLVYLPCVLEDGPCSPEGKELKDHMKPALENGCADCSEKQIQNVKKGTAYLIKERPDVWNKICEKLDPEGVYRKKYEEQAKQAGINYS